MFCSVFMQREKKRLKKNLFLHLFQYLCFLHWEKLSQPIWAQSPPDFSQVFWFVPTKNWECKAAEIIPQYSPVGL